MEELTKKYKMTLQNAKELRKDNAAVQLYNTFCSYGYNNFVVKKIRKYFTDEINIIYDRLKRKNNRFARYRYFADHEARIQNILQFIYFDNVLELDYLDSPILHFNKDIHDKLMYIASVKYNNLYSDYKDSYHTREFYDICTKTRINGWQIKEGFYFTNGKSACRVLTGIIKKDEVDITPRRGNETTIIANSNSIRSICNIAIKELNRPEIVGKKVINKQGFTATVLTNSFDLQFIDGSIIRTTEAKYNSGEFKHPFVKTTASKIEYNGIIGKKIKTLDIYYRCSYDKWEHDKILTGDQFLKMTDKNYKF